MTDISRRRFLQISALAAGATMLPMPVRWLGAGKAQAFYQTPTTVPLFGTVLRSIGQIPVAAPDSLPAPVTGVKHYTININEFTDSGVAPTLGATTLRGYDPAVKLTGSTQAHLGGIIVGKGRSPGVAGDTAEPIQITFRNNIAAGPHIIPNDTTIPGANEGNNRTAVHFHGGLVPWISDGGPFDWWQPTGVHGLSFLNNQVLNPAAAPNEAEYYYPLNQSARFGWYHDHAFGITRINAYAGVATGLLVRDAFEKNLVSQGLPDYIEAGGNEIPLVIQDKIFVGPNIFQVDPTWPGPTTPGSLWYAHLYEKNRWKLGPSKLPLPSPSIIAEFFGDTMLVNGTVYPTINVEPRRYRLRILNACNARFLNLQLYVADTSLNGITLNMKTGVPLNVPANCDPNTGVTSVLQIGTEGGFLPKPATIPTNLPFNPALLTGSLIVAPAERPDIIIDFKACAGQSIILYNDAPAPFPVGAPVNDYFPLWNTNANPVNALTPAGFGPNTRILMKFVVGPTATGTPDLTLVITPATNLTAGNEPFLTAPGTGVVPAGVTVRPLTLNEAFDAYGRLIQLLGTTVPPVAKGGFGRAYIDPPTEIVTDGATEVWEIYNTTADVHPMHFHLVNVQVINRQPFQVKSFAGVPANFTGPAVVPPLNEQGWKETVMMYPGTVTRIIMKFDVAGAAIKTSNGVTIPTPPSPRTGGNEYVWHCHILEHEEHDMMRPLVVL